MRGIVDGEEDDKWVGGKGMVPEQKRQVMGGWIFVGHSLSWCYVGYYPLHILFRRNYLPLNTT